MLGTIERVSCIPLRAPLKQRFEGGTYSFDHRATLIVEVEADGAVGRMYGGDQRDTLDAVVRVVRERLVPAVHGRTIQDVRALNLELLQASPSDGQPHAQRVYLEALSILDAALWDLEGHLTGAPAYELWGGTSPTSIPVYVSGGYYREGADPSHLQADIDAFLTQDIAGIKLKVGGLSPKEDLRRLEALRAGIPAGIAIACDANQAWSREDALAFARGAAGICELSWFEEPLRWFEQYAGLAWLSQQVDVPLCAGQNERSIEGAVHLARSCGVGVLNFGATHVGGPSAWLRMRDQVESAGVAHYHHEEPGMAVHLLATVTRPIAVPVFQVARDPIWHEMVVGGPAVEDGYMTPSGRPGFGLEFDPDFIDRHRVADK